MPKRSGGFRTIDAPCSPLKAIQREILEALTEAYHPTRSAFGFVAGRSIVGNSRKHVNKAVIVNIDLKDFFPSISYRRIRGIFMSTAFGFKYDVATVLAQICCRNGRLPQGAPTSPILSNFVCTRMDRELGALTGSSGGHYSRYCDDMTMSFSGRRAAATVAFRDEFGSRISARVQHIINSNGFEINYNKLKLRGRHERQEVTGLIVNAHVNVRRELIRQVRSTIHCANKFGPKNTAIEFFKSGVIATPDKVLAARVRGWILFVHMVRGNGDHIYADLARRYNKSKLAYRKVTYFEQITTAKQLVRALWVVEVEYDDPNFGACTSQGTAFTLHSRGVVTAAHVVVNEESRRPYREIYVFRVDSPFARYRAFVASFNPDSDVALLYLEGINYSQDCDVQFSITDGEELHGRPLKMVGFPAYRSGQSYFVGSAHAAAVHGNMIEIDNSIAGGISGGPLLDANYRVVGIIVKGVPGGGAKNEAVSYRAAFDLSFVQQDLTIIMALPAALAAPARVGLFRRCWGRVLAAFRWGTR